MTESTFEVLGEQGKSITRYGMRREVEYNEQFVFWSANEMPSKLWLPRYTGHAMLMSTVAVVRINNARTHKMTTAVLDVDPLMQPLAQSNYVTARTLAGHSVVSGALSAYLQDNLKPSDDALSTYMEILNDLEQSRAIRTQAIEAT